MKTKDDPARVTLETEKIQAWLAKGAQPTDRVLRFLDAAGLVKREAAQQPARRPSPARRPRSAPPPAPPRRPPAGEAA